AYLLLHVSKIIIGAMANPFFAKMADKSCAASTPQPRAPASALIASTVSEIFSGLSLSRNISRGPAADAGATPLIHKIPSAIMATNFLNIFILILPIKVMTQHYTTLSGRPAGKNDSPKPNKISVCQDLNCLRLILIRNIRYLSPSKPERPVVADRVNSRLSPQPVARKI